MPVKIYDEDLIFQFFTKSRDTDIEELKVELEKECIIPKEQIPMAIKAFGLVWQKWATFALINIDGMFCWVKHYGLGPLQDNLYEETCCPFSRYQVYPTQKIECKLKFIYKFKFI